ncbi:hypothetical protein B0H16DRAFT_1460721 [Mycena metata]|uniref:Uncharacterized protein n=1 Tax=Mycena metata TaxID=1033252 RepID=A0AAD7N9R8_9AGAR|nr:hypothetical protein B0H16DRAFT_1460721 [Mycena metata]
MAPKSWATTEQTAWLKTWMPDFIRRQAEHKLHLFWPAMIEAWVRKWPEHAALGLPLPSDATARALTADELATVGAAIKERKNKLENWFRNQRNKVNRANGGPTAAGGSTAARIQTMFNLAAPRRRRIHQPVEIFQRRNPQFVKLALTEAGYDDLANHPDEADDFTDEAAGTPEAQKKSLRSLRMRLRTHVVNALWEDVNDEERAAVMAELEKEKAEAQKEEEERQAQTGAERTAAEYQDGIDALDSVFADVHKAAYKAAGWVGMTIVGGPNPRMDGEMSLKMTKKIPSAAQQCASRSMSTDTATTDVPRLPRVPAPPVAVAAPVAKKCKKRKSKKSPAVVEETSESPEETPDSPSSSSMLDDLSTDTGNLRLDRLFSEPAANDSSIFADDMDVDRSSADDFFEVIRTGFADDMDVDRSSGDDFFEASRAGIVDPAASFNSTQDGPVSGPAVRAAEEFLATLGMHADAPNPRWPAGMTAPLSPEAAAAIAQTERGGMPAGATMAIDPVLEALTVSPIAGPTSSHPRPRPAFKSALRLPPATSPVAPATSPVATVNVDGFNFPLSAPLPATNATPTPSLFKRPSVLFEAFRGVRGPTAASTPPTPRRSSSFTPAGTTTTPKGPTKSALFLTSLLGEMNSVPTASTAPTASTVVPISTVTVTSAVPTSLTVTSAPIVTAPIVTTASPPTVTPTATSPAVILAPSTPTVTSPAVPASSVTSRDIPPTASTPIVTSSAANVVTSTPTITSPLGPKAFVAPETRPATSLSVAAPKKAPVKGKAAGDKAKHNVVVPTTAPIVDPTPFVAPETRPATSLSVAAPKKAPAKGNATKGKAANSKKVSFALADERENAAGVAHKTAVRRGRGRPSTKTNPAHAIAQTDGEAVERAWASANPLARSTEMGPGSRRDTLDDHSTAALGEVTNAAPAADLGVIHNIGCADPALTKLIRSREKGMQAREAEHQRKQEAAKVAAARKKQAAKGWIEDNIDGARVVVLTRARKPAKNADGTEVRVAGMRLTAADVRAREAEAKVLKALNNKKTPASGGKRKAETQSTGATKRRKLLEQEVCNRGQDNEDPSQFGEKCGNVAGSGAVSTQEPQRDSAELRTIAIDVLRWGKGPPGGQAAPTRIAGGGAEGWGGFDGCRGCRTATKGRGRLYEWSCGRGKRGGAQAAVGAGMCGGAAEPDDEGQRGLEEPQSGEAGAMHRGRTTLESGCGGSREGGEQRRFKWEQRWGCRVPQKPGPARGAKGRRKGH